MEDKGTRSGGNHAGEVEMAEEAGRFVVRRGETEAAYASSTEAAPVDISLRRLIFSAILTLGVQYGWALQLSLLTPYVQTLGLSHTLSSLMWLCGPIAGFLAQPIVGLLSDRCHSRFGRRRPFIFFGCIMICVSVVLISYSSDIGYALGDTKESCRDYHGPRWHAAIIYVLGFWLLDISNNSVQGPARALMADLAGRHGCDTANAIFCAWMAVGSILGYSSGSIGSWYKWFPFLMSRACCEECANLKAAFLLAVIFLLCCMSVTLVVAKEVPLVRSEVESNENVPKPGFLDVFKDFKNLPTGMPSLLFVNAVTWFSWFPFILYDTDWMGREIYHGDPKGNTYQMDAYNKGVRQGAFGLLLNSIFVGITSLLIEPMCRRFSAKIVWVIGNGFVCVCLAAMSIISVWSVKSFHGSINQVISPNAGVKAAALVIFAILGVPQAILLSVPFSYAQQLVVSSGGGQGVGIGILNISIVLPQVVVALGAGPWDSLFGKGNLPAFALVSATSVVAGIAAIFMLPRLSKNSFKSSGIAGGH